MNKEKLIKWLEKREKEMELMRDTSPKDSYTETFYHGKVIVYREIIEELKKENK